MNLNEIEAKCFIMALFIRDDGLRFLLGSGAYEFKDSQLMFAGNTIENDVVSIQGNDGYMLAGQVRRPSTQVFDGYIGDASVSKSEVEGYRRDFMAFFQKNHFYTVVYVMADGSAIQRRRGFLVDAPTSQELWQMYPEYHVALNFEDVNYYKYSENDDGEETYAKSADIGLAKVQYGGLIWDNDSEIEITGTGTNITLAGTMEGGAIESVEMDGDTQQQTYRGKNLLKNLTILNTSDNGVSNTLNSDGSVTCSGTVGSGWNGWSVSGYNENQLPSGTYTFSIDQTISYAINVSFRDAGNITLATANIQAGSKSATVTVNGQIAKTSLWLTATTGSSVNFTIKPQLESGNKATPFEPYVGGTASPNPDYPQEVQTVTGEQTVTVVGKNLLDNSHPTTVSANTTWTPTANGGLYSATTGWTGGVQWRLTVEEGATYQFQYKERTNQNLYLYISTFTDATYTTVKTLIVNDGRYTKYPIVPDSPYLKITFNNSAAMTNVAIEELMFEKADERTPFVPYQGQSYEINLGKNLFDKDNAKVVHKAPASSGNSLSTGSYFYSVYLPAIEGVTYTFSDSSSSLDQYAKIFFLSENPTTATTFLTQQTRQGGSQSVTATAPSGAKYLCVYLAYTVTQSVIDDLLEKLQIEKGSTATTYAPYFTPIELCKIGTYQDYIYKSGDDWYVHNAVGKLELDGTESWYLSGRTTKVTWNTLGITNVANVYNGGSVSVPAYISCATQTYFDNIQPTSATGEGFALRTDASQGDISAAGNGIYLYYTGTMDTTQKVTTYLSNNKPTLYYALATPTDTQITNATLISELEDLLSATTYSGNTYITVSGDLASPLDVKAITIGGGGVVWDENGAEWEAGGGGEIVIVNVDSIENILPVWTIRGEAENPTLTNLTTGMSITYNGTVASGQTLVIDLLNKTAKLNGTSVISDVSGQWVEFKPGNNRVSYSTENANAPDSTIEWQEVVG